jgi:hypothetical protein
VKRRLFLAGAVAVPVRAFVRPDALPRMKAVFEEVGNSVLVTLSLPALFRKYDKEALSSIDSGFDTTVEFTIKVFQHGARPKLVATRELTIKIRRNPWKKRYVVAVQDELGWTRRSFERRDDAIAAAVKLDRVRVCAASELERGDDGPYYFVTVLAQRNPLRPRDASGSETPVERGSGRDLEWFGRLVEVLAGERAEAEETVNVRTNAFYLVPR